jgi:hypothetical protein
MKKRGQQNTPKGAKKRRGGIRLMHGRGRGRGSTAKLDAQAMLDAQRTEFERRRKQSIARAALDLDPIDGAILGLIINHPMLTQTQIGEIVGLERHAVSERMNAPKFKRAVAEANRTSLEVFEKNKTHAARVLGRLLDSKDEHVALRAAIVHMWPHIHAEGRGGAGSDLVSVIQEAYELARAEKQKPGPESPTGGTESTE